MNLCNKIKAAKDLYRRFGDVMLKDPHVADLLEQYRDAIEQTQQEMKQGGVVQTCTVCAVEETGGCCFNGVEDWYDTMLLFINLLMGVRFPQSRGISDGCLFVGEKGCGLIARYHFCINYLCPKLKDRLSSPRRKKLMAVAGREIHCGIELENAIGNILDDNPESG